MPRNNAKIGNRSQLPRYVVIKKGQWHVRRVFATTERDAKGRIVYEEITRRCDPETKERVKEVSDFIESEYRNAKIDRTKVPTLTEFTRTFLAAKKLSVARRTYEMADDLFTRFVEHSSLGRLPLPEVKALDIQTFYSALMSRGYSANTVRKIHTFLSTVFNQALKWESVVRSPCRGVLLPKAESREIRVMDQDEARRFIAACRTSDRFIVFEFALETGLRPGEYLALRWADIDGNTVRVRQSLSQGLKGGGYEMNEPKTKGSRRTIKISNHLRSRLDRLPRKRDLVFPGPRRGKPQNTRNLGQRDFKDVCEIAGLDPKHFSLYSLRHTMATLSLAGGVNIKALAEKMGHADIKLLLSTYSHVLPDMRDEATEKLAGLLYA